MSDAANAQRPTNLPDLMAALNDIADPAPISMMPQTAGWAVLALIGGCWLIWGVFRGLRHRRATAYRRAALRELKWVGDDPQAISEILKRAALVAYPREQVAALAGSEWLNFLETTGRVQFDERFSTASYIAAPPAAIAGLNVVAQDWIVHHKSERST
jgi:hypothetical protein